MKITLEITLRKTDGKACQPEEVFETLSEHLDGETIYPQGYDNDEESAYEITDVRRLEPVRTTK